MTKKTKLSITVPVLLLILVLLVAAFAAGCVPMANAVENSATQGTGTASAQQTETPTPANTTAPAAVATLVSPTSSPSPTATAPTQSPAEPPSPKATATTAATAKGSETLYKNTEYGFQLDLPQDWKGYTVVNDQWKGTDSATGKTVETGPQFLIRNPKWTDQKPYQDIPVMVFTLKQWDTMQKDGFHIGAAPINPSELGRNGSYVFALPARYNYAYPTGWEEVEQYLNTKPLQTFNASK